MASEERQGDLGSLLLFGMSIMGFLLLILVSHILFDFSTGFELNELTSHSISLSRARIISSLDMVCIFNLTEGINLFSSACVSNSSSMSETLAYIYQDYEMVYTYDDSSSQKWSVYLPDAPSWVVQGIDDIDDRKGYIVVMKQNQTLVIEGTRFVPRAVPYPSGFSLIGIPSIYDNSSSSLFSSQSGSLQYVYAMNNSNVQTDILNLYYLNYTVLNGTGELQTINPEMGLWFYANDSGVVDITWQ